MTSLRSDRGFALSEFLVASLITLSVIAVALRTFDDALKVNDATLKLADAGQNMRSGVNLMVRDLLQAGREIPVGGIPIPTGVGATAVQRPSPSGWSYAFDNTTLTTLGSVTTGNNLGHTVSGQQTDMITVLMSDPFLTTLQGVLEAAAPPPPSGPPPPRLSSTGSSLTMNSQSAWFAGDLLNGVGPVKAGDLLLFQNNNGAAMQTVTGVSGGVVQFGTGDPFNLNQPSAQNGAITDLLGGGTMSVKRILMITYFVQEVTPGEPRLMRALNMHPAQALAGVVEDLQLTYDLVDGTTNPSNVNDVPFTSGSVTFNASQIRKVNLKVGVRSEEKSRSTGDYMRHYITTVTSLRNLAYVRQFQ